MLHIPILRNGRPYESIDKVEIVHHATRQPVAQVSQANSGLVARDIRRMNANVLESFTVTELLAVCKKAGELFMTATLPIGDEAHTFDDYLVHLSATTGMPVSYCRTNAEKVHRVFDQMDAIIAGLTRGIDPAVLDRGYGQHDGRMVSFARSAKTFGAVLPSNSPGVHGLWMPAIALKTPIVLKPGREEPWTPYRIIEAFAAAGVPREAFGFYPTDHAGAGELLRCVDRSMIFGGSATTDPYRADPTVEIHGPGLSKIVIGDDLIDDWPRFVDLMVTSIAANGGRSCINASGIWVPKHGDAIANALAERLAGIAALPADDPNARIAAFADPRVAHAMSDAIDHDLQREGAVDLTEQLRGTPRLVEKGNCAYILPTIIRCEDSQHPLANREFLFPYAAVVECPSMDIPDAIGPSLVVSAITSDTALTHALMASPNVDRLNIGAIPTVQLSWDQPHEGNLFEHLYHRRAFQIEPVA
ncbi:MAG: aldehyde dehydrogenase [Planctomycetes bacterium]|nr:aldehyde dehydrogenase [Planctomycetota bacterium]